MEEKQLLPWLIFRAQNWRIKVLWKLCNKLEKKKKDEQMYPNLEAKINFLS